MRGICQARVLCVLFLALVGNAPVPARASDSTIPHAATRAERILEDARAKDLILSAHNEARIKRGLPALIWNDSLSLDAKAWGADLLETDRFEHSQGRKNIGENLWMGTTYAYSIAEMMDAFLSEERDFIPGTFPNVARPGIPWKTVGHFTQIVWPSTREVGCAIVRGEVDDVLVCRYWPAGNVFGEKVE